MSLERTLDVFREGSTLRMQLPDGRRGIHVIGACYFMVEIEDGTIERVRMDQLSDGTFYGVCPVDGLLLGNRFQSPDGPPVDCPQPTPVPVHRGMAFRLEGQEVSLYGIIKPPVWPP